jgi:uncharacterized repeat protein (TIGR03833 family)
VPFSRRLLAVLLLALALTPAASATSNTTIKTILIVSHADEFDGHLPATFYYKDDPRYIVSSWNYCFQPMEGWGLYFDFKDGWGDGRFASYLELFEDRGFGNLLYVDVTECDPRYSRRWADSVVEAGSAGCLDLMSLNPAGSWYGYLRDGMVGMTRRFGGSMSGFAIDRLDRCQSAEESQWAAMLLDEVRASSAVPGIVYAMNSLQDAGHQGFLAARRVREERRRPRLGAWRVGGEVCGARLTRQGQGAIPRARARRRGPSGLRGRLPAGPSQRRLHILRRPPTLPRHDGAHPRRLPHDQGAQRILRLLADPHLSGGAPEKPMAGTKRSEIHPGDTVDIVQKQDQASGKLTRGVVKELLTGSSFHPHGIKVRLTDGKVGRVKAILPKDPKTPRPSKSV